MMLFFYTIIVQIAGFLLKIIAVFSPKIKLFVDGRKNVFEILQDKISHISVNYKMKDIFRDMPDSTIEDFYIDVTTEQKKYISILLKNGEVQTPKRWLSIYNGAEALANLQLYQALTTFPERYGIKWSSQNRCRNTKISWI